MNHTTNYQLNQWEKPDRIMMSDFNSDNSKIDTALKTVSDALAAEASARESGDSAVLGVCAMMKLNERSVTADVHQVSLSLPELKLSEYAEVRIYMSVYFTSSYLYLRINGLTQGYRSNSLDTSCLLRLDIDRRSGFLCARLMSNPLQQLVGMLEYAPLSSKDNSGIDSCVLDPLPQKLTTLDFVCNTEDGVIQAGSSFKVYGIR